MAPIRYSLHYEDYSEHLMSRFGKLLQMQSLVDMTLMCSSHTLRVHKAVLAASSAYFQEVLQKQSGEPLIILKMRFSVLKSLVEFMYCGKTQCLEENLDELVSAAQFLKIKGLSKVTKEGLGIANHSELPVFTPPVVINRPPQSLINLHSQDAVEPKPPIATVPSSSGQPVDSLGRTNKDMVVRIPFDIENANVPTSSNMDFSDTSRVIRPRRGRPSFRRSGGWDGSSALGRAAERALLRREQDSRKAIHQLKHLQTRHMQDYMDQVTLSQAVNSICDSVDSPNNYLNMDTDLMYMDQTASTNPLDQSMNFSKDSLANNTLASSYSNNSGTNVANETVTSGITTAMSQYVNALKNAGLPTDLPILFESGDGSYINVNEQVLLDMVQSSEIQYEVIEQPNIIEKVSDPSEIKSIDDLSKSIERGEMLLSSKNYNSDSTYNKENAQFSNHDDAISSLNAILPDNLDSFNEHQNYDVLDQGLQEAQNSMNPDNSHDFSCMDSDIQFFTKSMSDDVKKFYEEQQLNEARVMEQLCPSTSLDTSFNMSLLDTKISNLNENITQSYNSLSNDVLRRNDDCYDFSLQLPQSTEFKEDPLDCLISSSKQNDDEQNEFRENTELNKRTKERDDIIKDLMNIESKINSENESNVTSEKDKRISESDFNISTLDVDEVFQNESKNTIIKPDSNYLESVTSEKIEWNSTNLNEKIVLNDNCNNSDIGNDSINSGDHRNTVNSEFSNPIIDLTEPVKIKAENWKGILNETNDILNKETKDHDDLNSTLHEDIPFAVGLLPLKQIQPIEEENLLKRKKSFNIDTLDAFDAKCLKRKVKYKNL